MHSFMVTAIRCEDDDLQAIIMWPPPFIDMIKSMRHPLLFKHFVSFLAYVERFTTPVKKTITMVNTSNKWKSFIINTNNVGYLYIFLSPVEAHIFIGEGAVGFVFSKIAAGTFSSPSWIAEFREQFLFFQVCIAFLHWKPTALFDWRPNNNFHIWERRVSCWNI